MSGENLSTRPIELAPESMDPSLIETFLQEHPAFFKHRPELLMAMELPHGGDGAISLVERQVNLLRERNIEMRNRLLSMTRNAESNDALFEATRAMVITLLECSSAGDLPAVVETGFSDHFGVEYAGQLWFGAASDYLTVAPATAPERAAVVEGLLKRHHAFCGVFRSDEMSALFPGCECDGSAALAPLLRDGDLIGAIAVGSSDIRRYDSSVGTLFLEHIAEVIVRLPFVGSKTAS